MAHQEHQSDISAVYIIFVVVTRSVQINAASDVLVHSGAFFGANSKRGERKMADFHKKLTDFRVV